MPSGKSLDTIAPRTLLLVLRLNRRFCMDNNESDTRFREFLASNNFRMTPERQVVLREVLKVQGHFTADDFYVRLRQHHPTVSRATIYRTLDLLIESGLVGKLDLGGSQAFYEYFYGRERHDHLVCVGCGSIIEFVEPAIEEIQAKVCTAFGFEMESRSHKILGRCETCRAGTEPPATTS